MKIYSEGVRPTFYIKNTTDKIVNYLGAIQPLYEIPKNFPYGNIAQSATIFIILENTSEAISNATEEIQSIKKLHQENVLIIALMFTVDGLAIPPSLPNFSIVLKVDSCESASRFLNHYYIALQELDAPCDVDLLAYSQLIRGMQDAIDARWITVKSKLEDFPDELIKAASDYETGYITYNHRIHFVLRYNSSTYLLEDEFWDMIVQTQDSNQLTIDIAGTVSASELIQEGTVEALLIVAGGPMLMPLIPQP